MFWSEKPNFGGSWLGVVGTVEADVADAFLEVWAPRGGGDYADFASVTVDRSVD